MLSGDSRGAVNDVVLLNAAAAFVVAGAAEDITAGLAMASESISTGAARKVLEAFVAETTLNS